MEIYLKEKYMIDLIQLYARKGEIVTNIEILQSQLQSVNQQIIKLKNEEAQKLKPEKKNEIIKKT